MNRKFFYNKKVFNSYFDVVDVRTRIIPKYINISYFPDSFIITKIIFLLFYDRIKRVYVNGNHPNINPENRMFVSEYIKNKNMDKNIIEYIERKLENINYEDELFFIPDSNKISFHKPFHFYNKKEFNMNFDSYEVNKRIIPDKLIDNNNNKFRIIDLSDNFVIERIRIFTYNNRIQNVIIDSPHPNADIVDRSFCLPKNIIGQKISNSSFKIIEEILKIYNLKNPYFFPNDFIKIEK